MSTPRCLSSRPALRCFSWPALRGVLTLGASGLLLSELLVSGLLLSGFLLSARPCAAQSAIPPLTDLIATPGDAQSVELRWQTPLFEPGGAVRDRDCEYDFRYGSAYLTAQNFASSPSIGGSMPAVVWAGFFDIDLDFSVSVANNGTFPIYTVYWDQPDLRAWLYVGHDSPFIYGSAGMGELPPV